MGKVNLRGRIFWYLDILRGKRLKKELLETKNLLDIRDNFKEKKDVRLKKLLNHAVSSTTFYRNLEFSNNLNDFPLIDKNIIRDNLNDFVSSQFDIYKCKKVSTSGSTGTPFYIYQNDRKVIKSRIDNIYFSNKSNYQLGDFLVYLKIWPDSFKFKENLNFKIKNIQPISVFNLTDKQIEIFIDNLNKKKCAICFIGYASCFDKICNYLESLDHNPIKFKTKSIITISEVLNDYTRHSIKKYFDVVPVSRYSNNENGIIAQQTRSDSLRFIINDSSYIVEIFDLNTDRKLNHGERGRIIITDLYNYATPLIRYDTGDVGVMLLDESRRPYFSEISGRKLDLLYDTKGNLVPSHLSAKLCKYGQFKQFQIVQKNIKEYDIVLNSEKKVDEKELTKEYKGYFGVDAIISIKYVNDIPLLKSGKRREVVNMYYN